MAILLDNVLRSIENKNIKQFERLINNSEICAEWIENNLNTISLALVIYDDLEALKFFLKKTSALLTSPLKSDILNHSINFDRYNLSYFLLQSGAPINDAFFELPSSVCGLLDYLLKLHDKQIAKLIVEHDAANLDDLLKIAYNQKQIDLIYFLVDSGANPCMKADDFGSTLLMKAASTTTSEIFAALVSGERLHKELYRLLISKDRREVTHFLAHLDTHFSPEILEAFFIFCVNNQLGDVVDILCSHPKGLVLEPNYSYVKQPRTIFLPQFIGPFTCQFPEHLLKQKSQLERAYQRIVLLFSNEELCLNLLKKLDAEIAADEPFIGADFTTIKSKKEMTVNGLLLPAAPIEHCSKLNCQGTLHYRIKTKLNKYDIDLQQVSLLLNGFASEEEFKAFILQGALLKEQFFAGISLLHGTYSHYLQIYLVILLYEAGELILPKDLTLLDLLKSTAEVTTENGISVFAILFDRYFNDWSADYQLNFRSPFHLNTALMSCDTLPHLRGYLLTIWNKNIEKIQKLYYQKNKINISYEVIVVAQAFAKNIFDRFKLGFTKEDIANYYQTRAKIRGTLDFQTNIIIKEYIPHKELIAQGLFSRNNSRVGRDSGNKDHLLYNFKPPQ